MLDPRHPLLQTLSLANSVLITTHIRPDGDAIGSAAAMVLALRAKTIQSHVLLLSNLPPKYEFVFQELDIPHTVMNKEWPEALSLDSFDTFLVVDTGTWSQLPGLSDRIGRFPGPKLVMDHHLTQENWATAKLVDTQAGAAGEIVAELLKAWEIALTVPLATALFLAIASDTGWFQFSNTRPQTLRLAADLMETGLNTDHLYQLLYQNERAVRVLLQTRAQESLQLFCENRLAVMQVRKIDFEQIKADMADTENLINIPLQIRNVEVSLLFVEPLDAGPIRVSLRSKGQIDVSRFAEKFGGGGHARAAGLKVPGSLDSVRDQVVAEMLKDLRSGTRAAN